MSPLNKILLRDLWQIKGQALAIGVVIAMGVMLLVMMSGLVTTLDETRKAYYERYRLADIFAPTARAPKNLVDELAQIPGVQAVEGRVTGGALIDLPGVDLPLRAQVISLPDFGQPRLNALYMTAGRSINSDQSDEILLLEGFAKARQLVPGDRLSATMNGTKRSFLIVGVVQSPEYLYAAVPGEMVPDDRRFAVIWMSESALGAALDMQGAFNEALLDMGRGANLEVILDAVDRILEPYGGLGAYGLEDQMSNRFVVQEISGLEASAVAVPPIFLAIAAFLLYIVVMRLVQAQREQIGLLKAFGYYDLEVALHYFKLVLVIAVGGAVLGSVLGIASGQSMAVFYQYYFKFPFIVFRLDPASFVVGFVVSVLAASAGGLLVLRSVFSLAPAVAMRPPAPADFSRMGSFGPITRAILDQPSRMVLRRVMRQPVRMVGAMIGIATGMALSVAMIGMLIAFDVTIDLTFSSVDRSDMALSFVAPISANSIFELQRIDGVQLVEPVRVVPVMLRQGLNSYRGAITGLVAAPRLKRALDMNQAPIRLPGRGIVLAKPLAEILEVVPGDTIIAEVREGSRPVLAIAVAAIAQTLLGAPAYMEIGALNRALGEQNRVSGAYLRVDGEAQKQISNYLKNMPAVAGVTMKASSRQALEKMMDEGSGAIRYVMAAIAAIITFGIVYNTTRIAFAESARDLASLRVIGFTRGEAAFVLLGEIGLITLAALPVGAVMGYYLSFVISDAFSTEIYQLPNVFAPEGYGAAALAVLLASLVSGWFVKRDVDRLELVSALKTKE